MKGQIKKLKTDVEYTGAALVLQPQVYSIGDQFYCELKKGKVSVKGDGTTPEAAMESWDKNLQKHLSIADSNDQIAQYVIALLANVADEEEAFQTEKSEKSQMDM